MAFQITDDLTVTAVIRVITKNVWKPRITRLSWGELHRWIQLTEGSNHDDVIKWKHFPRDWSLVQGIHRSPVNSPPKDQWRGALMFCLICAWTNGWVNNRDAGDLRRHRARYDVTVLYGIRFHQMTSSWQGTWHGRQIGPNKMHKWRECTQSR